MTDWDAPITGWSDLAQRQMAQYRPVCGLAVAALIVSILSPLAFFHPVLCVVPLIAAVLAAVSLWQIARAESGLAGRSLSVVALNLALFCAVAAPVRTLVFYQMIDQEARRFARQWFDLLRDNQPHEAHQLTAPPQGRLPLDERLWNTYLSDSLAHENLDSFVNRPGVRQLLALGHKALVRYYDTESFWHEAGTDRVKQIYAVTYDDQGEKKTFFLAVYLARHVLQESGQADWEVAHAEGGVRPSGYRGPAIAVSGDEEPWGT